MHIDVGVGSQRRRKTCHSLRELDNQGTVLFFNGHQDGYRARWYCAGWRTLTPHNGMIASRRVNVARHPQVSFKVIPIAVSGVPTPDNKV